MKSQKHSPASFQFHMTLAVIMCWILPILIIVVSARYLLDRNYNANLRRTANTEIRNGLRQVDLRLRYAMEDAAFAAKDATVRELCADYHDSGDFAAAQSALSEYLKQQFSQNVDYRGIFVLSAEDFAEYPLFYTVPGQSPQETQTQLKAVRQIGRQQFRYPQEPVFQYVDDRLFLTYGIPDNPYCMGVAIELDIPILFQSLYEPTRAQLVEVMIDDARIPLISQEEWVEDTFRTAYTEASIDVDGHTVTCSGQILGLNFWKTVYVARWMLAILAAMVLPLLAIFLLLFHFNVNHPIRVLLQASNQVSNGQRGYQITERAPNREFYQLYQNFNRLSLEQTKQFDQLFEEQQALQTAKIRALQSQINPHFLNNTLEVINWEARMADNDRVCAMIDALSTMLNASIGRSGQSQVPLSEELKYVDAYLYITQERMGDRLTVHREIDDAMLQNPVPLLILQPLIENAVEHNLSRTGGELILRIFQREDRQYFEVEHDGMVSPDGWERIHQALCQEPDALYQPERRSVGIRNINVRLGLMYGENYSFTIEEISANRVLSRIILPIPGQTK